MVLSNGTLYCSAFARIQRKVSVCNNNARRSPTIMFTGEQY